MFSLDIATSRSRAFTMKNIVFLILVYRRLTRWRCIVTSFQVCKFRARDSLVAHARWLGGVYFRFSVSYDPAREYKYQLLSLTGCSLVIRKKGSWISSKVLLNEALIILKYRNSLLRWSSKWIFPDVSVSNVSW